MKISKKLKYWLFSSLGIISIGVAAIATPIIVLKQDNENITTSSIANDASNVSSGNKLSNFSTKWEVKTKEQQIVEDQFNQFLNFDGNNESSNTKDVTLLITNENSIKNKQLMTKISNGLKKLSVNQRNQIKNGMLTMHNLTKNNPITDKNIDSIYGHFINQDKINQIKAQVKAFREKNENDLKDVNLNNTPSLFVDTQNQTFSDEIYNLENEDEGVAAASAGAAVAAVVLWFCDWFGITTYAATSASIAAAILGIAAVGLGMYTNIVKENSQGYLNESILSMAHSGLMVTPMMSAFYNILKIARVVSSVATCFGWVVPAIFAILAVTSLLITCSMDVINNE